MILAVSESANASEPEPEIASSNELLARHPNEFVLYEVLEYTPDARVPRARLLGHGTEELPLIQLMHEYRRSHPKACLGLHWSGLHTSNEMILML